MKFVPRFLRTRYSAFLHDLLTVPLAWYGAYLIRFNFEEIPAPYDTALWRLLPMLLLIHGLSFWVFGLYRGVWRFASLPDLVRIIRAVAVAVGVSLVVLFLIDRVADVPRSVLPIHAILLLFFLGGPRLAYRWQRDHNFYMGSTTPERVLIVGVEGQGELLARELLRPAQPYAPLAFVDPQDRQRGRSVHGIPVAGGIEDIPDLVKGYAIDIVVIALAEGERDGFRRSVELCEQCEVEFRSVPHLQELVSGQSRITQLREISIEDLLGRDPVQLEWEHIRSTLSGRSILVTGGGGSIGSELCRQLAAMSPARLLVMEHSEFALYQIERDLLNHFPGLRMEAILGDVTDEGMVDHVMQRFSPEVVFHAAAYKHVPLLQDQVREAVRNNIIGTHTVASAADRHGVDIFVLISTDKAVNPTNIMGSTKRSAEIVCQHHNRNSDTRYITVRFGNVLGSAGSVVPLFREQIAKGGPVTVTHPEINRYFMTIPEACQLIMQASALGEGGEIFVLDMGEPVLITYLAEQMIRLSGHEPGKDIEITFTGLRPGEKLYEELFHESENLSKTRHEKILLAHHRETDWAEIDATLSALTEGCRDFNDPALRTLLRQLVPEMA